MGTVVAKAYVEKLIKQLRKTGQNFALAESCTGGALAGEFVELAGVSSTFLGGVVAYSNFAKQSLLQIPRNHLKVYGAVSLPVAKSMAKNVREILNADYGISITGIAGPDGGSDEKPVGTVCFSVVGPQFEKVKECRFSGNRAKVQAQSREFAVSLLLENLN